MLERTICKCLKFIDFVKHLNAAMHFNLQDSCVSITAHSFMKDGTRDFALSPDAKYITSVGMDDQSLCCFAWK